MNQHQAGNGYLKLLARVILGGAFAYLGFVKAMDPIGFLKLARQFEIVQNPLALNFVAAVLPWFEVFCGGLLLAGIGMRGTTLLILLLLIGFTTAIAVRAFEIYQAGTLAFCAIRFDCGCGSGDVLVCSKLAENAALVLLALAVLISSSRKPRCD